MDLPENHIRIGSPDEWFGILVPLVQVVEHGFLKGANSSVTATTDASFRYLSEQPLHQIQPTPASRREMNVIPRVPRQPAAQFGDLTGAIIVHDEMHLEAAREIGLDFIEKPQEFLMTVPPITRADGRS